MYKVQTIQKYLIRTLFIILFLLSTLFTILAYFNQKAVQSTQQIQKCLHRQYSPKTGDLVLVQYKSAGLNLYPNGMKQVPTHCGIVWMIENTAYVIDATKFDSIKNHWKNNRLRGVRLILLSDLINSIDAFVCIRPLEVGTIHFDDSIEQWANTLDFEPNVSTHMDLIHLITIGLGPLLNVNIKNVLATLSGLNSKQRKTVFCSEFISILLQKVGYLKSDFEKHWSISPLSLTSDLKVIDELCPNLKWGTEICLVCFR